MNLNKWVTTKCQAISLTAQASYKSTNKTNKLAICWTRDKQLATCKFKYILSKQIANKAGSRQNFIRCMSMRSYSRSYNEISYTYRCISIRRHVIWKWLARNATSHHIFGKITPENTDSSIPYIHILRFVIQ